MAKTLFNSSEKSNFILNLTEEKYAKMASFGMLAACFAVSIFTIPAECFTTVTYSFAAGGLAVSGVICLILAIIAFIKKYVNRASVLPVAAFGAMVLWGVISLINGYDHTVSFYGFPQRGEGLLAIIFYFCFFVTAASIKREKALKTLINGIIGVGLLNSAWGLMQILTGKFTAYKSISVLFDTAPAAGLSQSPIFLAMILTLSLTAALIGAIMSDSKKRAVFCIVSSCIFSFTMILTYTLVGICGIAFGIISAVITVFFVKASKKKLLSIVGVLASAALAVILAVTGVVGNEKSYRLYDGYILWSMDGYQRTGASGMYNAEIVDISNTKDIYFFLNNKTIEIIKNHPLTGTGPEQLIYPQLTKNSNVDKPIDSVILDNPGTFDKVYNEYLYTAATRGIPSLIALLAVILTTLYFGIKNMKRLRSEVSVCLLFMTLGGAIIFLIGCSNIAFSPIFWAVAGGTWAICGESKSENKKSTSKTYADS